MTEPMRLIGIGAGGHAKVVLEILFQQTQYSVVGFLDADRSRIGEKLLGVPILGEDRDLAAVIAQNGIGGFFVGVGAIRVLGPRRRIHEFAQAQGLVPVSLRHATAYVSPFAQMGQGVSVMAQATINPSCRIGDNVIINTGAIVEHDCIIADHVHIATGACLSGGVEVGEEAMIGAGSVIRQGIRIGRRALVGAGAVVVRDVPDDTMVLGNPAVAPLASTV